MKQNSNYNNTILNIICFIIPILGILIYILYKNKSPEMAISLRNISLWGVVLLIVLLFILFLINFYPVYVIHPKYE